MSLKNYKGNNTNCFVDNNTITTLNAPGGSNTSGALNFTSTGAATVSMTGSTINIDALDTDTRTKIRAGSGVHMVLLTHNKDYLHF